jgi:hypothetical protein
LRASAQVSLTIHLDISAHTMTCARRHALSPLRDEEKNESEMILVWQIPQRHCARRCMILTPAMIIEMISSSWMEDFAMTRNITDTKFPYVLVCSTFGAIVSLASVWLVTALTYAPAVVA